MKNKPLFFVLFLLSCFGVNAQTREDFTEGVLSFTKPEWYQSLAQPGKKKYIPHDNDSVLIEYKQQIDRKNGLLETSVQYRGEFKNGLFHGKGKLIITRYSYPFTRDNPYVFAYEGDFEYGTANGKGFLNNVSWYTPREMKAVQLRMSCQLDFKSGVLKSGLIRYDHISEGITLLTAYYSGELYLKNLSPVLHGLGIVYVSKNSPGSELAKRSPGIDGGIYAGNFYYGEYTGFAICNYFESFDKKLTNLQVGIVGKGELLHTFGWLPVGMDWTYSEPLPMQNKSEKFVDVFGDYKDVRRGVLYLNKENKYTGGIKDDLPHGIGYIENGNGFFDVSFWNAGKRLTVKEVLGRLLPDSSMTGVKKIKKKIAYELTVPNGTKTTMKTYDADYFGILNSSGNPDGWGVLLCTRESGSMGDTTKYATEGTIIGNFNGTDLLKGIHQNDLMQTIRNKDENQAFIPALRYSDLYSYYTFISRSRITGYNYRVNEYYYPGTPLVAVIETESFKDDMNDFISSKNATLKNLTGREKIEPDKVYLSSTPGKSYVTTSKGTIYLQELTADKVQYGDFILYNNVFYEVNSAFMLNDYVAGKVGNQNLSVSQAFKNQKCYVLRGYWVQAKYEPDPENICPYCQGNPPGKSTYTGVGYTGRYETNVYSNISGGATIVSKPITTIYSVIVDNKPCKYCKGVEARRRVRMDVVKE